MTTASASSPSLVLYTSKRCPYAQRSEIALYEANLAFRSEHIDLDNKPSWYASKINPASKVPVLVINADAGPTTEIKLPESLVISEYIAEEYADQLGESALLPAEAIDRARIRYLIERFSQLIAWGNIRSAMEKQDAEENVRLHEALLQFQAMLPPTTSGVAGTGVGPFFLGNRYSLAEVAIAPFFGRLMLASSKGFLPNSKVHLEKAVTTEDKFARLNAWWNAVRRRPSFEKSFDEGALVEYYSRRVAEGQKSK